MGAALFIARAERAFGTILGACVSLISSHGVRQDRPEPGEAN